MRPDSRNPIVISVDAEDLDGELRRALVAEDVPKGSQFAVIADEGEGIGGADSAPTPLSYFAASIAFCFMSQLSQFAMARKLEVRHVRVRQKLRFSVRGSRLDDSREVGCLGLESAVEIDSPEPPDEVHKLVAHAERTCFVVQSLLGPVPVHMSVTLNGTELPSPAQPPLAEHDAREHEHDAR
jgi:organic hydroperoxide reductase OsmC/OhrA